MYQEAATQSSEQGSLMDSKPFVSALSNMLINQLDNGGNNQTTGLGSIREDVFHQERFGPSFDDPSFVKNRSGNAQGMMGKMHAGMISHQSSGAEVEAHHNNLSRAALSNSAQAPMSMLIGNNSISNIRPGSKIAFVVDHQTGSIDSNQIIGVQNQNNSNPITSNPGYYRYSQEENSSDV